MATLNADTSWSLDIANIYENRSFKILLQNFSDAAQTAPQNWPGQSYKFCIADKNSGGTVFVELTTEAGDIEISGNQMIISCLDYKNALKFKTKTYFYNLIEEDANGISITVGKGKITINPSVE